MLDNGIIEIKELNRYQSNMSTLARAFKRIKLPQRSYVSFESNDHFLMIHQMSNLCLIKKELNIIGMKN